MTVPIRGTVAFTVSDGVEEEAKLLATRLNLEANLLPVDRATFKRHLRKLDVLPHCC